MERVHNFCAGPCTLPMSVVQELADELPEFGGSGMSLIEMSHRDPIYDEVHHRTMDLLRELYLVPDDMSVLLLQGGATLQFAMVPLNLLGPGYDPDRPSAGYDPDRPSAGYDPDRPSAGYDPDRPSAGYVVSGSWGEKALEDAELVGRAYAAWSGADGGFTAMPTVDQLSIRDDSRYLHVTSNETIGGIRLPEFFDLGIRQVADMSSDYLTRVIPWDRFDVVYGGAQKNIGPAGLTVVFVRNAILDDLPSTIPAYLRYTTHTETDSLANTPPVFAIWATGKVLQWMKDQGGLPAMEKRAAERSSILYDAIDGSDGFYISPVERTYRSHTNVVFRLGDEQLEQRFLTEAEEHRLVNLKGHRSVGGMRASIYNALPTSSVEILSEFMADFAAANG